MKQSRDPIVLLERLKLLKFMSSHTDTASFLKKSIASLFTGIDGLFKHAHPTRK